MDPRVIRRKVSLGRVEADGELDDMEGAQRLGQGREEPDDDPSDAEADQHTAPPRRDQTGRHQTWIELHPRRYREHTARENLTSRIAAIGEPERSENRDDDDDVEVRSLDR